MSVTLPATSAAPLALPLARAAQLAAAAALLALLLLHVLGPELDPSWHMISEYAYRRAKPALTALFLCWSASCWLAAASLAPLLKGAWAKAGLVLLAASGTGALLGAIFDVRHDLHGAAFGLGVPSLPLAAAILGALLVRRAPGARPLLVASAVATWLALALQAVTMAQFVSGLVRAGAFHPEARQLLTTLPSGVPAVVGYANRLLVIAYMAWMLAVGGAAKRLATIPALE